MTTTARTYRRFEDVIADVLDRDPELRRDWDGNRLARDVSMWLLRYRVEHGLTQTQLARQLGWKQPVVARLESGEHEPSIDTLQHLVKGLGTEATLDIRPDSVELRFPAQPIAPTARSTRASITPATLAPEPRSIWSGVLTFGMISISVSLHPATQDEEVSFHVLHEADHGHIKFKAFCATEDREVAQDELVRAYEVGKDEFVNITDQDLEKLPLPSRHCIELLAFVRAADIDPIYFEESYYVKPEEAALKPYALLLKVLEQRAVVGIARIAIRNRESLCALRPRESTLLLETLHYADEICKRDFDVPNVLVNDHELAIAGTLVDLLQEPFDPSKYHDRYREALLELIESKTQGKQIVVPEIAASAPVTDLMAALRASILEATRRRTNDAELERGGDPYAPIPVIARDLPAK